MRLRIFVRMELVDEVTDMETGAENTGLGHVIANKGGQAIKFRLRGTSFVFVSSHLAAHESAAKCQRRNEVRSSERSLNQSNFSIMAIYFDGLRCFLFG